MYTPSNGSTARHHNSVGLHAAASRRPGTYYNNNHNNDTNNDN